VDQQFGAPIRIERLVKKSPGVLAMWVCTEAKCDTMSRSHLSRSLTADGHAGVVSCAVQHYAFFVVGLVSQSRRRPGWSAC